MISLSSRLKAFFAYLFLAVGGIVILLISRKDRFAAFHARQSLALTIVAVLMTAVLTGISYLIALIPLVGPILASASFALVIGLLLALIYAWIKGMVNALKANVKPAPMVGGFAARWLRA